MLDFENKYTRQVCSPENRITPSNTNFSDKTKKSFGDFLPLHTCNSRLISRSLSKALTVNFKIKERLFITDVTCNA